MSRIVRTGRDWTAPSYRSPWQDERAHRYEPTTRRQLAALYHAPKAEPPWQSVVAVACIPALMAVLLLIWSLI